MPKLQPGDELRTNTCSWCGRGVREEDITETLDGSKLCDDCAAHYHPDQEDGDVVVYISNINEEEKIYP